MLNMTFLLFLKKEKYIKYYVKYIKNKILI